VHLQHRCSLSLSLAEGARVGQEEMCRHMCTFAVGSICTAAERADYQTFCIGRRDRATQLLIMEKCIYTLSVCMKHLPVLALDSEPRTMPHGAAEHVSQMAFAMLKHRYNKDRMFLPLNTTSSLWLSLSLSLSLYIYIYIYIYISDVRDVSYHFYIYNEISEVICNIFSEL
jgi:hypothetical protein